VCKWTPFSRCAKGCDAAMKSTMSQLVYQEHGRIRAVPYEEFIQAGKKCYFLVLFYIVSKNGVPFCVIEVVTVDNK
jgi:hypothetical protein